MMGATHVFIGTLSALALTEPTSPGSCLAALAGGALGGILCDIDQKKKTRPSDAVTAVRLTALIVLGCFALDLFLDTGLIRTMQASGSKTALTGATGLILLYLWGSCQPHRGGTHSIPAAGLFGLCAELVSPMLSRPLLIGMASHLVLDLLNSKPLRLFYPLRGGYCLNLCRADGAVDRLLHRIGLWGSVLLTGICIGKCL